MRPPQPAEDKDNERQDRRSGYGHRHRIYISAGIVITLLLIMLLYFKLGLLGLGGEEPDLCVERNRYGCVYGDYRRLPMKDETLRRPDTAAIPAGNAFPWSEARLRIFFCREARLYFDPCADVSFKAAGPFDTQLSRV